MPRHNAFFVLAAVTAVATAVVAARAPLDDRPNVIIYLPDSVRAESMSPYGHRLVQTPNAERLAASGTLFEQAHVQHTQCAPSRAAMLSGRYMHVLGHRTQTHLLQPPEPNLLAILKAHGYTTVLLGKNDALAAAAFNASLSYWENTIGVQTGANAYAYGDAGYYSFASKGAGQANDTARNADLRAVTDVAAWLSQAPPEPFAVLIAGDGAHPPYGAPAPYQHMYARRRRSRRAAAARAAGRQ